MKKLINFESFLNEGLRDDMIGKSDEEIRNIFKDKYNIDYHELEETIKLLNENGVECKFNENPYEPVAITRWSITRVTRHGQGWGLGDCFSEEVANNIAKLLKENMEEFWKDDYSYNVERASLSSTFKVSHQDALIILSKIMKDNEKI